MSNAIDLSNLHDMTGNDRELEKILYEEFFRACDEFMTKLDTLPANAVLEWRTTMHAFKGVALNLGALELGELCKTGQEEFERDATYKAALLEKIRHAYADVKQHIAALT